MEILLSAWSSGDFSVRWHQLRFDFSQIQSASVHKQGILIIMFDKRVVLWGIVRSSSLNKHFET